MTYQAIAVDTASFITDPVIKPKNVPIVALKEVQTPEFANINSPIKAPIKLPSIIPIGVKKMPKIRPIVAPREAALCPPVAFVIYAGIAYVNAETLTTI